MQAVCYLSHMVKFLFSNLENQALSNIASRKKKKRKKTLPTSSSKNSLQSRENTLQVSQFLLACFEEPWDIRWKTFYRHFPKCGSWTHLLKTQMPEAYLRHWVLLEHLCDKQRSVGTSALHHPPLSLWSVSYSSAPRERRTRAALSAYVFT